MSRKLEDLKPHVEAAAREWLRQCEEAGLDILITQTYRDPAEQARLYAQGRTAPGKIVTNARPGQSFHEYRVAIDFVPMRHGKPVWGTDAPEDFSLWAEAGRLAEGLGFEWSHRWTGKFRETAHIQMTGGKSIAELRALRETEERTA